MAHLGEFFGKLHPILLHFPLALLVVASVVEVVRLLRDSAFLSRAGTWLFALGAITAILAVGSGWLLAGHEEIRADQKTTLEWHRWLGIATAAVAALAWITSAQPSERGWKQVRRVIALAVGVLAIATGYFGGELVWGRDWFAPSKEHHHE